MPPRLIRISTENAAFQHVDALRRKRETRQKSREFLVEGVRNLNQALNYGWEMKSLLSCQDRDLSDWARSILRTSGAALHAVVAPHLWERISIRDNPSELLAIVTMPEDSLARLPIHRDMCMVIFDRPASPGNLGALIRSCDAFRVDGLVITGHATDLYDPLTVRASTGSFFAIPGVRLASSRDLLPWLDDVTHRIGPCQIVGSSAKATLDVARHDFTGPTILIIGNETWGMSAAYREMCDVIVTIPIAGSATSLNVACAASILLYEVDRQRRERQLDGI